MKLNFVFIALALTTASLAAPVPSPQAGGIGVKSAWKALKKVTSGSGSSSSKNELDIYAPEYYASLEKQVPAHHVESPPSSPDHQALAVPKHAPSSPPPIPPTEWSPLSPPRVSHSQPGRAMMPYEPPAPQREHRYGMMYDGPPHGRFGHLAPPPTYHGYGGYEGYGHEVQAYAPPPSSAHYGYGGGHYAPPQYPHYQPENTGNYAPQGSWDALQARMDHVNERPSGERVGWRF